jgi:hypothetical protein
MLGGTMPRAAHQQRIARQLAQLAQRSGDRGLRLIQFEGDAGIFLTSSR